MMPEEKRQAATYVSDNIGRHGEQPELEKLLQAAARKPRPFEVVIVYSPEILGTQEDVEITRARLAEHGVKLEFVHASLDDVPMDDVPLYDFPLEENQ